MREHEWTTKEDNAGQPLGTYTYYECERCGACGGTVGTVEKPVAFIAGPGLKVGDDCAIAETLIALWERLDAIEKHIPQ